MPTPSSAAIVAASRDTDLIDRMVALGARHGWSQGEVEAARIRLGSAPIDDDGNTIASIYEYAADQREKAVAALPPPVGKNAVVITDAHLEHALADTLGTPPSATA